MDETVHRRRVEAEVECSAAGWRRHAVERAGQAVLREDVIDFLQRRLHGGRLPRPGRAQHKQTQRLDGQQRRRQLRVDQSTHVRQHDLQKELLKVVAKLVAAERSIRVLIRGLAEHFPGSTSIIERHLELVLAIIQIRWVHDGFQR